MCRRYLAHESMQVAEDLVEVPEEQRVEVWLGAAHIQRQAYFIHYSNAYRDGRTHGQCSPRATWGARRYGLPTADITGGLIKLEDVVRGEQALGVDANL